MSSKGKPESVVIRMDTDKDNRGGSKKSGEDIDRSTNSSTKGDDGEEGTRQQGSREQTDTIESEEKEKHQLVQWHECQGIVQTMATKRM